MHVLFKSFISHIIIHLVLKWDTVPCNAYESLPNSKESLYLRHTGRKTGCMKTKAALQGYAEIHS